MTMVIMGSLSLLILTIFSCKKADGDYYNYETVAPKFDGTALEYISRPSSGFDSLLLIVNRVPSMRDSLNLSNITLFAIKNESFSAVINETNQKRKLAGLAPIYLSDVKIEQLDTMICRYVFRGKVATDLLKINTNGLFLKAIKFNYQMHAMYQGLNATGFLENGAQRIAFSDTHNSVLSKNWDQTFTSDLNLNVKNGVVHTLVNGHDFGFNDFRIRVNK